MSDDEMRIAANVLRGCLPSVVGFFLAMLICLLLGGCKTTSVVKEVPVTLEHTTERVRVDIMRDTVYRHDSVLTLIKGDTVVIERWHHYTEQGSVLHVDTVEVVREVPVSVTTTEVREVPKPLSWWQNVLIWSGALSLLCVAGYGIWKIR